jgi:hypothetical protein
MIYFISKTLVRINNRSSKPLIYNLTFIRYFKIKSIFSSFGLSEQAKLDNTSGNIGTTLSTKYTDVARYASSSRIPLLNNTKHQQYEFIISISNFFDDKASSKSLASFGSIVKLMYRAYHDDSQFRLLSKYQAKVSTSIGNSAVNHTLLE